VPFNEGITKFDTEFAVSGTKRRATQKAASFKTQGVLAPLLVRELEPSKYEVVAGARRLRAARIAELDSIPVRVVKLTDAEAIEAQVVELSIVRKSFLCWTADHHVVDMSTTCDLFSGSS
jgi:hypothetical protein